jgi:DNA-binding transcriptional LysR family regulator
MFNFERLRTLHAIATRGSVNAAATALHVTDSAVSQQIAKLESELGQSLLERNGRGVRLTDARHELTFRGPRVFHPGVVIYSRRRRKKKQAALK